MLSRRLIGCIIAGAAAGAMLAAAHAGWRYHRFHRYDALIRDAGARHGVEEALVRAVVWRESRFDAGCIGRAGEIGLMQVTEGAGSEWARSARVPEFARTDLLDPRTNLLAGTWYLARALRRWGDRDDPVPYALAEYNAGPSNARRWAGADASGTAEGFRKAVTYPTTRAYIRDILRRYRRES